jgi:peptidoglycan/LPS O-acetylase OafA/YrhL
MTVPASPAIAGGKLQSLNGLRAIAIIIVFFHHLQSHIPAVNLPVQILRMYVNQGWIGVDLFFVLSGFLITGILINTRDASNYFTGFYARRTLRIFPLYYVVLTLVIVLVSKLNSPVVAASLPLPEDRWLYFCYLTNWLGLWKGHWGPNYLGHFWSLAVEEQFYLVWPLVVWLARPRSVPIIAGTIALLSALLRLAWVEHSGPEMAIAFATISRLDALFVGALCAFLFRNREYMARIRKWLPWIASLGVGSFLLAFSEMLFFRQPGALVLYNSAESIRRLEDATTLFAERGGYTLLALGFGALVLLAAHTETESTWMQKFLKSRWLAPIGTYSYGIYVFHVPIIGAASFFLYPRMVRSLGFAGYPVLQCTYIIVLAAATFMVSALSYEFFEKRILRYKRYFEARYVATPSEAIVEDLAAAHATAGN